VRRTRSAVIAAALVAVGVGSALRAQQTAGTSEAVPPPAAGSKAERGARYLLRNGLDYLAYPQEYGRALAFLRQAEAQQAELSEAERQELKRGIQRAEGGLRRRGGGGSGVAAIPAPRMPRPGSIVLALRPPTPEPEPVERTSGTVAEPPAPRTFPAAATPGLTPPGTAEPPGLPSLPGASDALPAPPPPPPALTEGPAEPVLPPAGVPPAAPELPGVPVSLPEGVPTEPAAPPGLPVIAPSPLPDLAPEAALPPPPAAEELTAPTSSGAPIPPPAAPAPSRPLAVGQPGGELPSTLTPDLRREVQQMAERQDRELREYGPAGPPSAAPDEAESSISRLELPRAPSPTEARPIKSIPVPEEAVPVPPRTWSPSRKYWAAAAPCHGPLYFQDAALERYGQSAEQAFGPLGRCLSYPIDDPTQSDQRNQILQPFFSIGKFASQIVLLPYNLVVDPPGDAEYDLGYYRPGDRIPTDTHYVPVWGVGPPLRGRHY
jgi:hypothetical protein